LVELDTFSYVLYNNTLARRLLLDARDHCLELKGNELIYHFMFTL